MAIDYIALAKSMLKNNGTLEEHKDTGHYHLMLRKSCQMTYTRALLPYVLYTRTDEYYRHFFIKRPYDVWERTKLLIILTTAILKVEKVS